MRRLEQQGLYGQLVDRSPIPEDRPTSLPPGRPEMSLCQHQISPSSPHHPSGGPSGAGSLSAPYALHSLPTPDCVLASPARAQAEPTRDDGMRKPACDDGMRKPACVGRPKMRRRAGAVHRCHRSQKERNVTDRRPEREREPGSRVPAPAVRLAGSRLVR
jgi:hypothetical protein